MVIYHLRLPYQKDQAGEYLNPINLIMTKNIKEYKIGTILFHIANDDLQVLYIKHEKDNRKYDIINYNLPSAIKM